MKRILNYPITPEEGGTTIETFLRTKGYSRHILTHLKKTKNGVLLNVEEAYTNKRMEAGDILQITLQEDTASLHIPPVPLDISVVYEDEDLMVIDKAADMPIHPSLNNYENTLANGIAWYFYNQGIPFVYRCINRLDRDTTGLLIIAKNMLSAAILSKMVEHREIHRRYLGISAGCVPESGIIDAPIARALGSTIERCVNFETGEHAVTHFQRLSYRDGYSLVSLKLETGRTHQIRVHMKHLGFPLIGDYLYNPDTDSAESVQKMQRQALHSHNLEFIHPITGEMMNFTSPLPPDMNWI